MKFAHYDENTLDLLGWYSIGMHSELPVPTIGVSDNDWTTALGVNANKVNVETETVFRYDAPESDADALARVYKERLNQLHKNADGFLTSALNRYSQIEISTFPEQRKEAENWRDNNNAATPKLDQLAHQRGIERLAFIQRVLGATETLNDLSFLVVAQQQKKEDELSAAKLIGLAALESIDVTLILHAGA